jgi:hypothetical protein
MFTFAKSVQKSVSKFSLFIVHFSLLPLPAERIQAGFYFYLLSLFN